MITVTCRNCKQQFNTNNKQQMYCKVKCRNEYNNKPDMVARRNKDKPKEDMFDWAMYRSNLIV
jgi:hypothetical protein